MLEPRPMVGFLQLAPTHFLSMFPHLFFNFHRIPRKGSVTGSRRTGSPTRLTISSRVMVASPHGKTRVLVSGHQYSKSPNITSSWQRSSYLELIIASHIPLWFQMELWSLARQSKHSSHCFWGGMLQPFNRTSDGHFCLFSEKIPDNNGMWGTLVDTLNKWLEKPSNSHSVNLIFWNHILISCFINRIPHFFSLCHNDSRRERELWKRWKSWRKKMVVKYIQELRGKESDSIFFLCRYEALKIVASTMDSACWAAIWKWWSN